MFEHVRRIGPGPCNRPRRDPDRKRGVSSESEPCAPTLGFWLPELRAGSVSPPRAPICSGRPGSPGNFVAPPHWTLSWGGGKTQNSGGPGTAPPSLRPAGSKATDKGDCQKVLKEKTTAPPRGGREPVERCA